MHNHAFAEELLEDIDIGLEAHPNRERYTSLIYK